MKSADGDPKELVQQSYPKAYSRYIAKDLVGIISGGNSEKLLGSGHSVPQAWEDALESIKKSFQEVAEEAAKDKRGDALVFWWCLSSLNVKLSVNKVFITGSDPE